MASGSWCVGESRFAENEKVALDGAPRGDVAQHVRESALAPHSAKAASGHERSFKVTQLSRRTISGIMARCGNSGSRYAAADVGPKASQRAKLRADRLLNPILYM